MEGKGKIESNNKRIYLGCAFIIYHQNALQYCHASKWFIIKNMQEA